MSRELGEPPSEITPDSVCVAPKGGVKNGSPAIVIGLLIVKFAVSRNDSVVPAAIANMPVPNALLLPATSVPFETVVPPAYVLADVSIN